MSMDYTHLPVTKVALTHMITVEELAALNIGLPELPVMKTWDLFSEVINKAQNGDATVEIVSTLSSKFLYMRIAYDGNVFDLPAGWFSFKSLKEKL